MNCLISIMLEIAEERYMHMLELLKLAEEQTELLVNEDIERFKQYVLYRQNVIDRVSALDTRYEELNAQMFDNGVFCGEDSKSGASIQKIMGLHQKTKGVSEVVVEIDKENAERGEALLEKLRKVHKYAKRTHVVFRTYREGIPCTILINS